MQLSYNLIKNNSTLKSSHKLIETNYVSKATSDELGNINGSIENDIKKSYEVLGYNIKKKPKWESEEIIMKSRVLTAEIEKKAYEEGYNQGKSNGFEDGYNEGLKKVKEDTEEEIRGKIDKAEEKLQKPAKEYKEY